jgi:hypothetical protein
MLFAFRDSPAHSLGDSVARQPSLPRACPVPATTPVRAVPARETDTSIGSPASVAAEPHPHGAYSREETYRKESE